MDKAYNLHDLKGLLAEKGLKATTQRLIIYQAILQTDEHPTAEQVYDTIREAHPSISLGTVYKTLDSLVNAGLAHRVKTGNDVQRFDAKVHHHNHLYVTNTSQIIDYEDQELQKLLEDYFARKHFQNFKVTDFQVQVNGEIVDKEKNIKIIL